MYRAMVENKGDSKYYATATDHHFVMDTEGQGAGPVDVLLASLCACLGHYVREYAREHEIAYDAFTVTAESNLAQDGTRLSDIGVSIDLRDARLAEQQQAELLKYIERCKIRNTLKANSDIIASLAAVGRSS